MTAIGDPKLFTAHCIGNSASKTIDNAALNALYDALENASIVAVDTETTGLAVQRDALLGVCLSVPPWTDGWYVPVFADPQKSPWYNSTDDQQRICDFLREFLAWDIPKIFHNAIFDVPILIHNLRGHVTRVEDDTMLLSHIADSEGEHGLKELAVRYIHPQADWYQDQLALENRRAGGSSQRLEYWSIPIHTLAQYGAADAVFTGRLREILLRNMPPSLVHVYRHIAIPLLWELLPIVIYGIPVDRTFLERGEQWYKARIAHILHDIQTLLNDPEFNPGSVPQLQDFLKTLCVPAGTIKQIKSGLSTDAETLKSIIHVHPVISKIIDYRETLKIYGTYFQGLLNDLSPGESTWYPNIRQVGTRTGRLSIGRLHQIPRSTPLDDFFHTQERVHAPLIRQTFAAPEGYVIVGGDHSQIEARVLAHFSQDPALLRIYRDRLDIHAETARMMFAIPPGVEVDPELRQKAKSINFALLYLESIYGLSRQLQIEYHEAEGYYNRFFRIYSQILPWAKQTIDRVRKTGYVEMISGRRRYIRQLDFVTQFYNLPSPKLWNAPTYALRNCFGKNPNYGGIGMIPQNDLAIDLDQWTPNIADSIRPIIRQTKRQCAECTYLYDCYYLIGYRLKKKYVEHIERQALNSKIQGSAADIVNMGIIRMGEHIRRHNLDARLIIYVHDEVHYLVSTQINIDAFCRDMSNIMTSVGNLSVPLEFNPKPGKTWADIK